MADSDARCLIDTHVLVPDEVATVPTITPRGMLMFSPRGPTGIAMVETISKNAWQSIAVTRSFRFDCRERAPACRRSQSRRSRRSLPVPPENSSSRAKLTMSLKKQVDAFARRVLYPPGSLFHWRKNLEETVLIGVYVFALGLEPDSRWYPRTQVRDLQFCDVPIPR